MRKLTSIVRYIIVMLTNLLGVLTSYIMFPLLYPFRIWITTSKIKPFWYYFDDEDGYYGSDSWREEKDLKKNFWTALKWSWRNPAWNLQASLSPKKGVKTRVSSKGWLERNGKDVDIYSFAVIKTEDFYGNYTDNFGKYFSYKYSILGKMFVWYRIKGRLYFRYSKVWKVGSRWLEIMIGTNDDRYLFRFKIKKLLTIK